MVSPNVQIDAILVHETVLKSENFRRVNFSCGNGSVRPYLIGSKAVDCFPWFSTMGAPVVVKVTCACALGGSFSNFLFTSPFSSAPHALTSFCFVCAISWHSKAACQWLFFLPHIRIQTVGAAISSWPIILFVFQVVFRLFCSQL